MFERKVQIAFCNKERFLLFGTPENALIRLLLFLFIFRPSGEHCLARDLRPPLWRKPCRPRFAAYM